MQRLGVFKVHVGSDPGAGAEWVETVPARKWWYIVAISIDLVQGATQTPRPTVLITDGLLRR